MKASLYRLAFVFLRPLLRPDEKSFAIAIPTQCSAQKHGLV
jgi:hypothetical protein